jgi:hypothetical protein
VSSTSAHLYKSPIQKMAALPIALAGAGAAAGAAAAGAKAGLVQPVMDLTKSAVKFVADVSEKIGEEKKTSFSLFNSHSIPLFPL